ncbi:MAG: hypothetical protein EAZ19_17920 [Oscillatoriales cyanobacterium]|nr:MAG: hypothetical protein EAZ25_13070 [Oscillatoriales cyanobacterium]TAG92581.1 MAG: hypothetical protein EAZ19_17920 [Oscillatoriales cyanobacterium]
MGVIQQLETIMSKAINGSALKLSRASKIQVEVKEIAKHATAKNISSALNVDADGSDVTNE